jgi:uncharacterized protein YjeT (DUF2065 family)
VADLLSALGLVLVLEGALWALFPDGMRRAASVAAAAQDGQLRRVGLVAACLGVGLVWLVRH